MLEHFEGNIPARIPRTQTMLKTVPTRGFRQETLLCIGCVKIVNVAIRIKPKKENVRKKIEAKLVGVLKSSPLMLSKDLGLPSICRFSFSTC